MEARNVQTVLHDAGSRLEAAFPATFQHFRLVMDWRIGGDKNEMKKKKGLERGCYFRAPRSASLSRGETANEGSQA